MNYSLESDIANNKEKQILSRNLGFTENLLSDNHAMVVNISEIEGHIFDINILKKSLLQLLTFNQTSE